MLGKSRYGLNGDDYDEEDEKRAGSDKSSGPLDFHYQTGVVFEYSCVVCVFLFNAAGNVCKDDPPEVLFHRFVFYELR